MTAIKQEIQKYRKGNKLSKTTYKIMLYDLEQSKWKKVLQQMN